MQRNPIHIRIHTGIPKSRFSHHEQITLAGEREVPPARAKRGDAWSRCCACRPAEEVAEADEDDTTEATDAEDVELVDGESWVLADDLSRAGMEFRGPIPQDLEHETLGARSVLLFYQRE